MPTTLSAESVSRSFGGVNAVDNVSFSLRSGEILGLIGPNGSGKSTLVNLLSGSLALNSGRVLLDGRDCSKSSPSAIARMGMIRTYQGSRIFEDLQVWQNVAVGIMHRADGSRMNRSTRWLGSARQYRADSLEVLQQFGLDRFADERSGDLSYGNRRAVEIARAVAAGPSLLLCDEPVAGMNDAEVAFFEKLFAQLASLGIGLLIIEHHVEMIMSVCERVLALNQGRIVAEGPPAQVRTSGAVREAYLGVQTC